MELEIPRGAAREYLTAFGIAAVYVATAPAGRPCMVGATRDLAKSLAAIRRTWRPDADITVAYWVQSRAAAEHIVRDTIGGNPPGDRGVIDATGEEMRGAITAVAAVVGITLTDHDAAMSRVNAAVSRVKEMMDRAQATGGLKFFNRSYREWRAAAKSKGIFMSYNDALARLRKALIMQIASGADPRLSDDILKEIFPKSTFGQDSERRAAPVMRQPSKKKIQKS